MGRRKRPYSPGTIFHLMSRTHRGEQWYVPALRTQIAALIPRMVRRSDAELLAYAIMPNHLHVVVRQGQAELEAIMQPLLRRVARRVQRYHNFEGGVVERRYRDRACASAEHVREVLVYNHLNPLRAGLCDGILAYPWTTHRAYLSGADPGAFGIDSRAQLRILELFAAAPDQSRDQLCRAYMRRLEWRIQRDAWRDGTGADPPTDPPPERPTTTAGDLAWGKHFASAGWREVSDESGLPDLRDFLRARHDTTAPALGLEELRGSHVSHPIARARKGLMAAATRRGYRTGQVASFFDVSPQTVSRAKYAAEES